jgi:hypothetical protein
MKQNLVERIKILFHFKNRPLMATTKNIDGRTCFVRHKYFCFVSMAKGYKNNSRSVQFSEHFSQNFHSDLQQSYHKGNQNT